MVNDSYRNVVQENARNDYIKKLLRDAEDNTTTEENGEEGEKKK